MIELKQLNRLLDELYGTFLNDYCPNGLQVEGKRNVTKIATAVSADAATIEAAIKAEADALIVHHGLFWNKDPYPILGSKKSKLSLLLKHDISLFAYHLPMDCHPVLGNNWHAAKEMGWTHLAPFFNVGNLALGVKGEIEECSQDDLRLMLENYYKHQAITALGGKKKIKTVALISGGAHRQISDAIQEGIDAFVTGSFDEPVWHQAIEGKINFFALGHSATERVGPKALNAYLNETLSLPSVFIDTPNPF